jgi:hypothetical protein
MDPAKVNPDTPLAPERRGDGRLTRFLMLRLLGLVYLVAFASLAVQYRALLGDHGLTPVARWFEVLTQASGSEGAAFLRAPSLFWFGHSDAVMVACAWIGAGLALAVVAGVTNALLQAVLWALYLSFVHVGQEWYGFGWEIQLCETGFLAIFLCPLLDWRPFPKAPPPRIVVWLFRWLIARVMLGAGLIKLRGDPCWRDLSALCYHFETQPLPNPISRWLHFAPRWLLQGGTLFNHFVELIAPWLMLLGRRLTRVAGACMLLLQVMLIVSGNLSFLNWLTIVPILACFDDDLLARLLPRRLVAAATSTDHERRPSTVQLWVARALALVILALSVQPVINLVSPDQVMNTSFDPLDLVNTYGAFGSVGKERLQLVIEGTAAEAPDASSDWREYPWKAQPSDPMRAPPFVAPWQWRIDWEAWFAAMSEPREHRWLVDLASRLLTNDPLGLSLMGGNPFPDRPPRWIRIELYRYRFAPPGDRSGAWWTRQPLGEWLVPIRADDPRVRRFLDGR